MRYVIADIYITSDVNYTIKKKCTQHEFDRLYFFYPGFAFIKLHIPGKPVLITFRLKPYSVGLFHWGCVGCVNLGQCQKGKVAKLIGLYGKMPAMSCFVISSNIITLRRFVSGNHN